MVGKLRRKLILIVAGVLFFVLLLLLGGINLMNLWQMTEKSDQLLAVLLENDGVFPENIKMGKRMVPKGENEPPKEKTEKPEVSDRLGLFGFRPSEETPYETRYFTVTILSEEEEVINLDHIASVTEEEAVAMARRVAASSKSKGQEGTFRFAVAEGEEGTVCVFLDCSRDLQMAAGFAAVSAAAAAGCFLLVLLLVILFSQKAISPMVENMEKQKRFITDAGHELKTPIAIIAANAEVIEMCQGESEWTRSIKGQTDRMNDLVTQLLTLARMEESNEKANFTEFDCSWTVREAIEPFIAVAKTKNLVWETKILEGLRIRGEEARIRQMVTLLVDNAVKYAPEGGNVHISFQKNGRKAELTVYNTCSCLPEGDLNCLFDRFYRADESRSRKSGGYGIGLAVARAIVENHRGKITAERKEDGIVFRVILPEK
ncbi:MAG: sensor histidine kinase [Fusicatenibacter sp.]